MGKQGPTNKSFGISKQLVWEAYKQVKANKGAAGVDGVTLEDFETDLGNNLYKIWNRMSSGTYFPPPVKAVEIPKQHGTGTRILGVPTVADRIAQTVVALALEPRTESIFHPDSYGYRPGRSPLQAVKKCRERCWKKDWVVDLDIQKFFDSIDHDLMVKAVEANITTDQKWVLLYAKRWLKAPLQLPDGTLQKRDRGTPQGSAVSPVLANLFLHYAMDSWLGREFPTVEFERFADDAVRRCVTERRARQVRDALAGRPEASGCGCIPTRPGSSTARTSRGKAPTRASFTFLGYTFRPRSAKGKNGKLFTSFLPAVSPEALKAKGQQVRRWRIQRRTGSGLHDLAERINPIVRGWMQYYGRFHRSALHPLLRRINAYLMRWARRKYKRLSALKRFNRWWTGLIDREPGLFAHWVWVRGY